MKRRDDIHNQSTQLFLIGPLVLIFIGLIVNVCLPENSTIGKNKSMLLIVGGVIVFLLFWSWFSHRIVMRSVANAMGAARRKKVKNENHTVIQ